MIKKNKNFIEHQICVFISWYQTVDTYYHAQERDGVRQIDLFLNDKLYEHTCSCKPFYELKTKNAF